MTVNSHLKLNALAVAVIVIDQATKYFAYAGKLGGFLNFFNPFFGKSLLPNYNFAFSIHIPHVLAYLLYAIVVAIFCLWYFVGEKMFIEKVCFYLVISGALSNLIDRIFLGYVRDFIWVFWGNVFNFADVAIVCGVVLILLATLRKRKTE